MAVREIELRDIEMREDNREKEKTVKIEDAQSKLLRLADKLEREMASFSEEEDRVFYTLVIMGIRHPSQLLLMIRDNPKNDQAKKALDAIGDLRLSAVMKMFSQSEFE